MIDYVYVEREALLYPACKSALEHFKAQEIVIIDNYKEIFNRPNQNYRFQKQKPALILAVNRSRFIYEGAENCQDFGNDNFYYCSCGKNCLFSCDYCYLQGMYRTGNIVAFVNMEDCFREAEALLAEKGSLYLCLSYDSDIFALEQVIPWVKAWNEFAKAHEAEGFTAELRTKGASAEFFRGNAPCSALIYAWTLTPPAVTDAMERRTAPVARRIEAALLAAKQGFRVRICLDPIIDLGDGKLKEHYAELAELIGKSGLGTLVDSASVGPFRVPAEYIKIFKKNSPVSLVSWYDYEVESGTASYGREKSSAMNEYVSGLLIEAGVPADKIFDWEGKNV